MTTRITILHTYFIVCVCVLFLLKLAHTHIDNKIPFNFHSLVSMHARTTYRTVRLSILCYIPFLSRLRLSTYRLPTISACSIRSSQCPCSASEPAHLTGVSNGSMADTTHSHIVFLAAYLSGRNWIHAMLSFNFPMCIAILSPDMKIESCLRSSALHRIAWMVRSISNAR